MGAMRRFAPLLLLFAACDGNGVAAERPPEKKEAVRVASIRLPEEIERVIVDGNGSDEAWRDARATKVALAGPGPPHITIRSAWNDRYAYFLLVWPDGKIDRGNVCVYEEPGTWKMREGEDAVVLVFPPAQLGGVFRERGFATFVEDGAFAHPGDAGFADLWYWGAQTTSWQVRARDHWLQPGQRLRGDAHPDQSDNVLNWSAEYDGPVGVPKRITADARWFLPVKNAQSLDPVKMARMSKESNFGWTVPAVIQRPIAGSRGDVFAKARFVGGAWTLEIARKLDTGHRDDHPLGVSTLLAVAVYDGTANGARVGEYGVAGAVSGAIELDFVSAD